MHPVQRLRLVRLDGEKTSDNLVSEFRRGRRQGVVSNQLSVGYRHIFGLEKFGALISRLLTVGEPPVDNLL